MTHSLPASPSAGERSQVRHDAETLCSSARRTIVMFLPEPARNTAFLQIFDSAVIPPGVRTRIVVDAPYETAGLPASVELRVDPLISERFLVIDDHIALTGHASRMAVVRAPVLVSLLGDLFEHVWSRAERRPRGWKPPFSLTEQEKTVLRMAAEGLTDEVIGRQLGLTSRTVRRHMANAMERIGAQSRLQAGVRIAKAGIV
ncbi:helix-turn-helix transcriptional regulator [Streptosporangium sp. NPDC023963]|uniref:helix-turn-helix transcriptional regulator n=1 Tax=Streptosporangium sp. NPDC023963 TaxID=3155608 RepID=UPI0034269B6B